MTDYVPYRGGAPALTDLLGGQVQVFFAGLAVSIGYIKAGKLHPGYELIVWYGVGAPENTPPEIISKLNNEINAALASPVMKARLADQGATPLPGSPADFGKLIADETQKWAKVIRAANIKPQ
jgi:tripartite-type tricarboxylate transporter receptor subunit TctC